MIINERVFADGRAGYDAGYFWLVTGRCQRFAQLLGLKLKSTGGGYAVSQSIKDNTVLKEGDALQVRYKAK